MSIWFQLQSLLSNDEILLEKANIKATALIFW